MTDNINTSGFEQTTGLYRRVLVLTAIVYVRELGDNAETYFHQILSGIKSNDMHINVHHENLLMNEALKNLPKNMDPNRPIASYVASAVGDNVLLMKSALFCDNKRSDKLMLLQDACIANNLNIAKYIFSEYSACILALHTHDDHQYTTDMMLYCKEKGYNNIIKWYFETVIDKCNEVIKKKYYKILDELNEYMNYKVFL